MKNIFSILLFLLVCVSGHSQKLDAAKVPQTVKDAFKNAHPNAATTWEREDGNYEANFKEGGKSMSCVINNQGTILETESPIAAADLPASARAYMNQHYKGRKWKEVAKIVKASGEVNYEVNIGTDVLFDSNGHHLQKKEKKEKD